MFNYTLKKSKRAKNLSISINSQGKVTVTKPWFLPVFFLNQFLQERESWVKQTLAKIQTDTKLGENEIYYLGQKYQIIFKIGKFKLDFDFPYLQISAYNQQAGKRQLMEFLQKEAIKNIKTKIKIYAQKMEIQYEQVRIKDQETRWGSCSSQNNLNFSWRLIMAPPKVLDYVIIHELAHLEQMNHSYKFWDVVEKYDPDYRENRRWLKKHQNEIQNINL